MKRRKFIQATCFACSVVAGGSALSLLSACTPSALFKTEVIDNTISVPLEIFNTTKLHIVRAKGYDYNIAVKKVNDSFSAIVMRCTHADNPLQSTGNGYTCALHGSTFDTEGRVTKGPAQENLTLLNHKITSNQLIISL